MATIKLARSTSCSRCINYAEPRATVKSGLNCDVTYAKTQMKATRMIYGKDDKVQAHTLIQSFKPGEVTPEQANELGFELAQKVAAGHQVAIYTHTDKDHIHNHLVINSVNMDTGLKFQAHGQKAIREVKDANDQICLEHGLTIPEEPAKVRYTTAEKSLLEKGKSSWKDEIREVVDQVRGRTSNFKDFSALLNENGIDIKLRGKTITYTHLNANKKVRASKLGSDYEKETIFNGFERQTEPTKDRDSATGQSGNNEPRPAATDSSFDRDPELQRSDATTEKLRESQSGEQLTRDSTSNKYRPEQLQQQLEKLRNHTDQLQRDSSKAVNRILETPENDPERPVRQKQDGNLEDPARNESEQRPIKRDQPNHHQDHGPSL
ncbi:relaxase/mobilization nuclease domain-containing protein [Carnobacterium mobile]|uniref:relaxase/mobilization nuclease domain-containing protein n=1 Tax=Carnobacterium mobile TaxID=2750 RepID=UPI001866D1F0|nr:relaxase/mobilization nuclease domain-containing protein [Carnobacterium mobile]